jgi:hypothetical protein
VISKKYRKGRIVALSTGNVYGLINVKEGGSVETASLAPVGDYAMSCLGRERIFQHFSQQLKIPMTLIRLNYACDLRYGVLVDLARKVRDGITIDLSMGFFNTLWQGDANAMILQAFDHATYPPTVLNVTGRETLAVRDVCERLGGLMERSPKFVGRESPTALLSDARRASQLFGAPRVSAETLISWVADWVMRGGASLDKPTHFESRDGKF